MPINLATKLKSHQIYFLWLTEELVVIYTVLARRLYGINKYFHFQYALSSAVNSVLNGLPFSVLCAIMS